MFLTRPFEIIWMKNISDQVTFDEGLKDIGQNNKTTGLLQKLQDILPRDYVDAFYGQTYPQKIGS